MRQRVVITGYDVICSLGTDRESVRRNLKQGQLPITELGEERPSEAFRHIKAGKAGVGFEPVRNSTDRDQSEQMAVKAFHGAMTDAGFTDGFGEIPENRISLSLATSVMGSEHIIEYAKGGEPDYIGRSKQFEIRLAQEFGIGGELYTTSAACASGTAAIGLAAELIRTMRARIVVCCCTDHICAISLYGFRALNTLSHEICRPFDKKRDGINIGEGSACFILESYESAVQRKARIRGEVTGYGLANDACHITSPDPEGKGAFLAMRMAVEDTSFDAPMDGTDRIYINAHGTGTPANDSMELKAIKRAFDGENTYVVSSTKSMTGHCLGAAGGVELALGLMMLEDGQVYPTLHSNTDIEEGGSLNERIAPGFAPDYVISNSFAFGGNDAVIIVRKTG